MFVEKPINTINDSIWADGLENKPLDEQLAFMIKNKSKWDHTDPLGQTMLMSVIRNCPKLVKTILDLGINVNKGDKYGYTPLMTATTYNVKAVSLLIDAGAEINAVNHEGQSPLFFAVSHNPTLITPLIKFGANPNLQDKEGNTPFMSLVNKGYKNTFTLSELFKHEIDIFIKNNNGDNIFVLIENKFPEAKGLLMAYETKLLKKDLNSQKNLKMIIL